MSSHQEVGRPVGRPHPSPRIPRRVVVAVVVIALGAVAFAFWARTPSSYVEAQWLFAYGEGLRRRSLVGTAFGAVGGEVGGRDVEVAATLVYVAAVLVVAWAASRGLLGGSGRPDVATPLVVAVLLAPSGLPALAAGLGQLDTVVVVLAVLAALAAGLRSPAGPFLSAALLAVAVLAHEAAIVLVVPWVAVYVGRRHRARAPRQRWWVMAAMVAAPAVLVTAALLVYEPPMSQAALAATLGPGDIPPHHRALAAGVHVRDAVDNIRLTWLFVRTGGTIAGIANVVAVLPVAAMSFVTLREAGVRLRGLQTDHRALLVASLVPLSLCLAAMDWGRWFSVSASLLGITTVMVVRDAHPRSDRPVALLWVGVVLTLVVTFVAGGTGEHPFRMTYVR